MESTEFFQLCARRGALKLEIKGLYRSGHGRTAYSICKQVYGLKGNRQKVLDQLNQMIKDEHAKATGLELSPLEVVE